MARVITFSRTFPVYHPKAGQQTFFVEKILNGIATKSSNGIVDLYSLNADVRAIVNDFALLCDGDDIKHHTIRSGNRWKAGDYFSPRVWSAKPYASPMITIAPDIKIEKVWDILINLSIERILINGQELLEWPLLTLAENDGLSVDDFIYWFGKKEFTGQIICWNKEIEY